MNWPITSNKQEGKKHGGTDSRKISRSFYQTEFRSPRNGHARRQPAGDAGLGRSRRRLHPREFGQGASQGQKYAAQQKGRAVGRRLGESLPPRRRPGRGR